MDDIQVAAGIIWREGRFLAARRPEGKAGAGFWEFPGGKQEAGEDMHQALIRELGEELGIKVPATAVSDWKILRHEYPDRSVCLHFMQVTEFLGEPRAREGQELRWLTPAEAPQLPFLSADEEILVLLAGGRPMEQQTAPSNTADKD